MKYPRLPDKLNRRKKLFAEDLERMKELRKLGLTYKEIGEAVGVQAATVGYHLNPETKRKTIERALREIKYRWKNDPSFRARKLEISRESKKYISKVNPDMNRYKRSFDK